MAEEKDRNVTIGVTAVIVGVVVSIVGALWAHFTGLPAVDDVGRDIYPNIPRGWVWVLIGQVISLGGLLLAMAGITLAYLWEKKMTWARSAVGAGLYTGLMMILFGVIPNEWLTYTQAVWEWTDQKIWIEIPANLVGGNEINISAAVFKDVIAGTYAVVAIAVVAVIMIRWQKRDELRAKKEQKKSSDEKLSVYGRPLQKVER